MQGEQTIADGGIGEYIPDGGLSGVSLSGVARRPMRPAYAGVMAASYDDLVDMGDEPAPVVLAPQTQDKPKLGARAVLMPLAIGAMAGLGSFFLHRDRYGDEQAAKLALGTGVGMTAGVLAIGFVLSRVYDTTADLTRPRASLI